MYMYIEDILDAPTIQHLCKYTQGTSSPEERDHQISATKALVTVADVVIVMIYTVLCYYSVISDASL